MGRADPVLARRARCSSGGERNLPAVVCPVLQLERKWRHELRLRLVRAMHDDRDARLRRLLRAQSLVSGLRQRPKRRRKPAPGETELGPLAHRAASRALLLDYLGGCLSSSSILALNTSPSFSSSVSPRLLPG